MLPQKFQGEAIGKIEIKQGEVEKQTVKKAKQDGTVDSLRAAALKAAAAAQAMTTALKAAKVEHENALAQTKTLPEKIATGNTKLEQAATEITLALAAQKTAKQQFKERSSQIDTAQKNLQSATAMEDCYVER